MLMNRSLDGLVAKDILTSIASYGLQKTSMQDIADAAGVSRQSIYKKYGSKEACYHQSVNEYLAEMYGMIFTVLNEDLGDPRTTLVTVFDILIGEAIDLISRPHGTEVLDTVLKTTLNSNEDWRIRFRSRLGAFLLRRGLVQTEQEGLDLAVVAISASKGILLEESSGESFRKEMGQIIDALFFNKRN